MKIAILALQGAFAEHEQMFRQLGTETTLIRNLDDFYSTFKKSSSKPLSISPEGESFSRQEASPRGGLEGVDRAGLAIPGGESTAMMRIMKDEGLFEPLRQTILDGLPVLGTCAGLIMLDRNHLNVMDITARRNAYGRQLGSFNTKADFKGIGRVPMTFIRAPYIEEAGPEVEILARVDGKAVAARQRNMLVTAFHPELTADTRIHELFLKMVASRH